MSDLFGLRDYQEKAVFDIESAWKIRRSVCFQLCTGGGKSRILRTIIDNHHASKKVIYVVAHRGNLIRQLSDELSEIDIKHGIIKAGFPYIRYRVQVCSIQTLSKRLDDIPEPEIIIIDECHHTKAKSYENMIKRFPQAKILGVTATPERTDGKPLSDIFDILITGPEMRPLIDRGFLSDYEYLAPSSFSTDGLHLRMGDYVQSEVLARVDKKAIIGSAVEHYRKYSDHLPAIAACVSIDHAEHVAEEFCAAGYKFKAIHSRMKEIEIYNSIRALGDGSIEGLTNCDLIGEGTDIPVVTTLIGLRPTNSLTIFLQYCGRVLRRHKDKEKAIILDHVNNFERHGLPDDHIDWSLSGRTSEDKGKSKYKRCPECYHPVSVSSRSCQYCGFLFRETEETGSRIPEQIEGVLVNVKDKLQRKNLTLDIARNARTLQQAIGIAKRNGIKHTEAFDIWTITLKNKQGDIIDFRLHR